MEPGRTVDDYNLLDGTVVHMVSVGGGGAATAKTSALMKRMATRQADPNSEISAEEALELLEMLDSVEEAQELCKDLGMQVDGDMPMEALIAALKGHLSKDKTVRVSTYQSQFR